MTLLPNRHKKKHLRRNYTKHTVATSPFKWPEDCLPSKRHKKGAVKERMSTLLHTVRLDYVSCFLTILGTIMLGKKLWQGWIVAAINSAVVCVIGVRTAQFGFVPANLLCIALYASNLVTWRVKPRPSSNIEGASRS